MKQFIGLTHLLRSLSSLKRDAIFFDRIGITLLDAMEWALEEQQRIELDLLKEQGVIFEPWYSENDLKHLANHKRYQMIRKQLEDDASRLHSRNSIISIKQKPTKQDLYYDVMENIAGMGRFIHYQFLALEDLTLLHTIELNELTSAEAIPIIGSDWLDTKNEPGKKSDIILLLLKNIPIPSKKTSWEDILNYRRDPNSKGKFFALRNWISEMAKSELNPSEIEEKFNWLLFNYDQHLRLHKMKFELSTIEMIVTVGAKFLENLMKLKFENITKIFFLKKNKRLEYLKTEIDSPGSELAYIYEIKKKFNTD